MGLMVLLFNNYFSSALIPVLPQWLLICVAPLPYCKKIRCNQYRVFKLSKLMKAHLVWNIYLQNFKPLSRHKASFDPSGKQR